MSKARILFKIRSLGSPKDIAILFKTTQEFISCHRLKYPKPSIWSRGEIYVLFSNDPYIFKNRKLQKISKIPDKANVLVLTRKSANDLVLLLDIEDDDPALILKKLLTIKNMKRYKEILTVIDDGFKTNLSFAELSLLIKK